MIAIGAPGAAKSQATCDTDSLLQVLDRELPAREGYRNLRRDKISAARRELEQVAANSTDAYNVLRTLYSLYRTFDADSAMWVARMRLDVARQLDDSVKIVSAKLNMAEISIAMGSFSTAGQLLGELDRRNMLSYHLEYYYRLQAKLYHYLRLNDGVPEDLRRYEILEKTYLDSLAMLDPVQSRSIPLIARARAAYQDRRYEAAKNLFAQAALNDVRDGRRDMEALMRLAAILCDEGDYERAYNYISVALDEARAANAYSRTAEILQAASIIERAYVAMTKETAGRMHVALAVIVGMTVIAIAGVIYAVRLLRINRRAFRQLEEANDKLEQANRMKEVHISRLFESHSRHIEQISALRKQCLQQLRAGELGQLEKTLTSHSAENSELQGMYARFDEMFLSMYPHFIEDYNSHVDDEYRMDASTGTLTPELRVLALVTMGITDSGSIARLLHYSPQTVYNYRSRLKLRLRDFD